MKYIALTRGLFAIVDDEDYGRLSPFKWFAAKDKATYYALRKSPAVGGKQGVIRMHREILQPGVGLVVDHINGDGLDNRRANIREATRFDNARNRRTDRSKRTSQYKGVCRRPSGKWSAALQPRGSPQWLGTFLTQEDAARAYNEAAARYYGEFACLNQIDRP